MIRRIDLRGTKLSARAYRERLPRAAVDIDRAAGPAAELIRSVRERGEQALADQAERFDGVRPPRIRIPTEDVAAAADAMPREIRAALEESASRVATATRAQLPAERTTDLGDGARVLQRWVPVSRAGLYVPGGKAVYPSSVVMNVVPAQVAGVASIAVVSPPQKDARGGVHPLILGAAGLLGVDEVYAAGGAGAIGALAWGVPGIGLDPVDVITGPGNVYVAAAKRLVRSQAGIDAEAGPTEILVIADETADPRLVAADLVSQAEHDENAAAVLVTDADALVEGVAAEVERLASATRNGERVRAALAGTQSALVLVDDLEMAVEASNAYGPEHLEVHTRDPEGLLPSLRNAGAIFLGPYSPVSLGDYLAGSNHVLPTGGQARFSAGLGAGSFLRAQQVVRYDRDGLERVAGRIVTLADAENLPAHGEAVSARFGIS